MTLDRAAAANDAADFEQLACAMSGGWIDALAMAVPGPERARYEAEVAPGFLEREHAIAWLQARPRTAAWVLARWCLTQITEPKVTRAHERIVAGASALVMVHGERVETPWLWCELVAATPKDRRELAHALPCPNDPQAAVRAIFTGPGIANRVMLAEVLVWRRRLDKDVACAWLTDRVLRGYAERWLAADVATHEAALRDALVGATGSTREAIVRLLRTVDPRLALDGQVHASDDGELQTLLRADPNDATAAAVWADALADRGDPRGEYITLELAIRRAKPTRALELSARQAELWSKHRKAMFDRPGGFPFREKYRGRGAILFASDWNHRLRATTSEKLLERVQRFLDHVTTSRAPQRVYLGRRRHASPVETTAAPVASPPQLAVELMRVLGDAITSTDRYDSFVELTDPDTATTDVDALHALVVANPDVSLEYTFALCWPGTQVRLPHQEPGHYPGDGSFTSRLGLHVASRGTQLVLAFPFERFDDPRFVEVYEAICATLGRTMTSSRWSTLWPTADGRSLTGKRTPFTRR